jgi:hypothetical protein
MRSIVELFLVGLGAFFDVDQRRRLRSWCWDLAMEGKTNEACSSTCCCRYPDPRSNR